MRTDAQLREVFNATFDVLPPEVRSKIEDLWRQNSVHCEGNGRFIPPIFKETIILYRNVRPLPGRVEFGPQSMMSRTIAAAERAHEVIQRSRSLCGQSDGLIFRFKAAVVDQAPDEILRILIAHELAHAQRAAEVGRPFPEAALARGTSEQEEEQAANALLAQWGFNLNTLLQWLQDNEATLRL
jgi:hypothetical protein